MYLTLRMRNITPQKCNHMFKSQGKKLYLDILFEKMYTSFPHRELSFDIKKDKNYLFYLERLLNFVSKCSHTNAQSRL